MLDVLNRGGEIVEDAAGLSTDNVRHELVKHAVYAYAALMAVVLLVQTLYAFGYARHEITPLMQTRPVRFGPKRLDTY